MASGPEISASGFPLVAPEPLHHQQLTRRLSPEQHQVTQKSATEAPFCGGNLAEKSDGVYACVVCHLPLFRSEHKFDSGTGWPSFFDTFDPQHVCQKHDESHGMVRIEITCGRCDAHLGHAFPDGPPPTGTRHCLNSASLHFYPEGQAIAREIPELDDRDSDPKLARAWFGGG
ncbi:MAG: peptide-methionine (R)-S-oxide reductase MsrB [Planctomycetota bacterium]|nr:peptide-methionine (R)-S-oxide reductase MsrB [Planctomycetota bacterium]